MAGETIHLMEKKVGKVRVIKINDTVKLAYELYSGLGYHSN